MELLGKGQEVWPYWRRCVTGGRLWSFQSPQYPPCALSCLVLMGQGINAELLFSGCLPATVLPAMTGKVRWTLTWNCNPVKALLHKCLGHVLIKAVEEWYLWNKTVSYPLGVFSFSLKFHLIKLAKENQNIYALCFLIAEITSQEVQLLQVDRRESLTIQLHSLWTSRIKMMSAILPITIHIHIQLCRWEMLIVNFQISLCIVGKYQTVGDKLLLVE